MKLSSGIEPLLHYRPEVLRDSLRHCAAELERPVSVILEDLGTWVIAAGYNGAARRLLRFCGADFADFLFSLNELPDRARLALPDLNLPELRLEEVGPSLFRLVCKNGLREISWIMLGALRAMADDYGALVLIEAEEGEAGSRDSVLAIRLLASHFSEGRAFALSRTDYGEEYRADAAAAVETPPPGAAPASAPDTAQKAAPDRTAPPGRPPDQPAASIVLARADFDHLQPLHIILSETGTILSTGPLIRRMFPGEELRGTPLLQRFRARVTGQGGKHLLLPLCGGQRIRLELRSSGLRLRGISIALPPGEGVMLACSFGIDIIRAVEALRLTDSDFSATDMTMELLCLTEANGLALEEMRALSRRLEGARRQAEDEALTDSLTGLRNRRACDAFLARLCRDGSPFSVLHLDLDHFKEVNDRHGHAAGDEVLIKVAAVLSRVMRSRDCIARVGGDEFLAIIPGMEQSHRTEQLVDQLITQIARPVPWQGTVCKVSVSIGMVLVPGARHPKPAEVLALVDKALYAAKAAGRNCSVGLAFPQEGEGASAPGGRPDEGTAPEPVPEIALKALIGSGLRLR